VAKTNPECAHTCGVHREVIENMRPHQRRIELRTALLVQRLMQEEPFPDQWEPMETAPLDGTPIQVRRGELKATVSWSTSINAWVIGLATEPDECDRMLPWHPTAWNPVPGALE
jgi:hypothetical protein